jgi:sec-independent protein translocase protein TatB
MFGIGFPELILILVVALLVVGPSRLPQVARSIGKALGEFRRMTDDVKETIENELIREDEKADEPDTTAGEPPDNKNGAAQREPLIQEDEKADEPDAPAGEPPDNKDAPAHEPAPPHESEASAHGEPEAEAAELDPLARKGP